MAQAMTEVPAAARADEPAIRRITLADLREVLAKGWEDFLAIPTQLVFLGVIYPVVGLIAARFATGDLLPLLFPLLAGLSLLGPVVALGLYEISRRRELDMPVSARDALAVLRSPSLKAIVLLGGMLFALFVAWLVAARLVYLATLGEGPHGGSLGALLAAALTTRAGWMLILIGNGVGLAFAIVVLTLTVVSFPLLLDRPVDPLVAVRASVRAVATNPVPMLAWGLIVAVLLVAGALPLLIGLAVVVPVLGHATWHLYRRVVAW
ncbi:DUF2189 domain-containing protein [Elioraea sp.]|uniref:DUF2189 domain-containing protein n=1 Tax=Elioraea sp. TaxID=2185103 RepID=UPI00307E711F